MTSWNNNCYGPLLKCLVSMPAYNNKCMGWIISATGIFSTVSMSKLLTRFCALTTILEIVAGRLHLMLDVMLGLDLVSDAGPMEPKI